MRNTVATTSSTVSFATLFLFFFSLFWQNCHHHDRILAGIVDFQKCVRVRQFFLTVRAIIEVLDDTALVASANNRIHIATVTYDVRVLNFLFVSCFSRVDVQILFLAFNVTFDKGLEGLFCLFFKFMLYESLDLLSLQTSDRLLLFLFWLILLGLHLNILSYCGARSL